MDDLLPGLLIGLIFGFLIGTPVGIMKACNTAEKKAIEASVAEYYLDKDNKRQFRYISTVKENQGK